MRSIYTNSFMQIPNLHRFLASWSEQWPSWPELLQVQRGRRKIHVLQHARDLSETQAGTRPLLRHPSNLQTQRGGRLPGEDLQWKALSGWVSKYRVHWLIYGNTLGFTFVFNRELKRAVTRHVVWARNFEFIVILCSKLTYNARMPLLF